MPLMSGTGLWLGLSDYTPSLQPAVILCSIFIVLGLFVLFFVTKRLTYDLNKTLNQITFLYPVRFVTKHEVVTFSIDEVKGIIRKKAYLQWSPFEASTTYFEPSSKEFMINYRVENIELLVGELRTAGVTILDKIETYAHGKFVHILDPENNNIEL